MPRSSRLCVAVAGLLFGAAAGQALGDTPFCADPADPARPSQPAAVLWERKPPMPADQVVFDYSRLAVAPDDTILAIGERPPKAGEQRRGEPVLVRWNRDGAPIGLPIALPVDKGLVMFLAGMEAGNFVIAVERDDGLPPIVVRVDGEDKVVWRRPLVTENARDNVRGLYPLPDGGILVATEGSDARAFRIAPNGRVKWDDKLPLSLTSIAAGSGRLRVFITAVGAAVMREYTEEPSGEMKFITRPLVQPSNDRHLGAPLQLGDGRVLMPGSQDRVSMLMRFTPSLDVADVITVPNVGGSLSQAAPMPDGGLVAIAGMENAAGDAVTYCFVRFDKDEREVLRRSYSVTQTRYGANLEQLKDGTFVLLGRDHAQLLVRLAIR